MAIDILQVTLTVDSPALVSGAGFLPPSESAAASRLGEDSLLREADPIPMTSRERALKVRT